MADITSIEPYEAVTVNDTTDETRTDLPALIQRMENQIALQNQVIRQFLEHWDSISQKLCKVVPHASDAMISANAIANQHVQVIVVSEMGSILLTTDVDNRRLILTDQTNNKTLMSWTADYVIGD